MGISLKVSKVYLKSVNIGLLDAAGAVVAAKINMLFHRIPVSRVDEINNLTRAGQMSDKQVVHEVVAGWPDGEVVDDDGNPLAFSAEALDRTMDAITGLRGQILRTWYDSQRGESAPGN